MRQRLPLLLLRMLQLGWCVQHGRAIEDAARLQPDHRGLKRRAVQDNNYGGGGGDGGGDDDVNIILCEQHDSMASLTTNEHQNGWSGLIAAYQDYDRPFVTLPWDDGRGDVYSRFQAV